MIRITVMRQVWCDILRGFATRPREIEEEEEEGWNDTDGGRGWNFKRHKIYRSRDWKAADLWTERLKRIEEILYLGFRMAPALSNLVILTPCSEGSQNTPRGTGEERKKMRRDVRGVAWFVRARHLNENLPMRFHMSNWTLTQSIKTERRLYHENLILRNMCFNIFVT